VGAMLVKAGSGSFLTNVAGAGLGFASQIMLAQIMGKDQFGPYIFVVSWIAVLVIFSQAGFDRLLLRFLSVHRAQSEWPLFRGIARGSVIVALGFGGAIGSSMAVVVWALRDRLDVELSGTFYIAAIVLPLLALVYICQNGLQALGHPVLGQLPILVLRPAFIIMGVGLFALLIDSGITASRAMQINLAMTVIVLIVAMLFFRARTPLQGRSGPSAYQARMWTLTALPLVAQAGFHMLARRTDVLMLGVFTSVVDAGVYAAAARLAEFGGFGLLAMNAIAAPLIAVAYADGDRDRLQRIAAVTAGLALSIALPVTIIFCTWGGVLLRVYGEGFDEAQVVLAILAVGMLGNVLTGPVGVVLMMTGHQKQAAAAATLTASVNVVLNLVLIPRYGSEGAAVATAITYVLTNSLMLVIVFRSLRLNPTVFGLVRRVTR